MDRRKIIQEKLLPLIPRSFGIDKYFFRFIEKIIEMKRFESSQPQLFILGLPRSGTTLIYQYIVHRLNVACFTHEVGRYYHSPCLVTFFQNKIYGPYQSDFRSSYGKITGSASPREAGAFWGRFFGLERYIRYEEVSPKDIRTLQNTVACIQHIFGNKPFVNKNVKHMLRIDALSKIFPDSYFLIVERNLNDVALSTIRARYNVLKNPRDWWSVKPPDYESIKKLPAAHQVARQLMTLKEKLETDLSCVAPDRVLQTRYEDFCNNPEYLIDSLKPPFTSAGYRNNKHASFAPSSNHPQNQEEEELIKLLEVENASE